MNLVISDIVFAHSAIISVAHGPSGPNDAYLLHLHEFLTHAATHSPLAAVSFKEHAGDDRTGELANMVKLLQRECMPYFLAGAGSNEHDQLLLKGAQSDGNNDNVCVDEVNELTEMLLVVPRNQQLNQDNSDHVPKSLHAGGGHSALLTNGGDLYLWGWNDVGQLGRSSVSIDSSNLSSLRTIQPLRGIKVETVDLGHTHTLFIEKRTGRLFGFGENGRGQVTGCPDERNTYNSYPRTPIGLSEERFANVAAGLFHSAAITKQGELITWGCSRFGQCLPASDAASTIGRWSPSDGSRLVHVACGRRHTILLDEHGRVWTMGDNKYGQLGQGSANNQQHSEPQLVEGPLGQIDSGCFAICSGWSHILALTKNTHSGVVELYGWGRNDKGQLGPSSANILSPQKLLTDIDGVPIQSACCGAESSHILSNGNLYSTGWNEHGNLGIGLSHKNDQASSWTIASGISVAAPPPSKNEKKLFSAGGAHLIVMAM